MALLFKARWTLSSGLAPALPEEWIDVFQACSEHKVCGDPVSLVGVDTEVPA